ncbi:hypothetical protein FA13DRAFT_1722270 [Coprinellus micaceus]|uniref:Uncharacterized protein n=1 Tax=Coprinellus micaceus TaxID=71717 RepID=A0A4Y7RMU9_COPMI|nr:hypothetical protein FA13DRAFT_1722270 [Coprinellus micaceus]
MTFNAYPIWRCKGKTLSSSRHQPPPGLKYDAELLEEALIPKRAPVLGGYPFSACREGEHVEVRQGWLPVFELQLVDLIESVEHCESIHGAAYGQMRLESNSKHKEADRLGSGLVKYPQAAAPKHDLPCEDMGVGANTRSLALRRSFRYSSRYNKDKPGYYIV